MESVLIVTLKIQSVSHPLPGCLALLVAVSAPALSSQLLIAGMGVPLRTPCCGHQGLQLSRDPVPILIPDGLLLLPCPGAHVLHMAEGCPSTLSHPEEAFKVSFFFLVFPLLLL